MKRTDFTSGLITLTAFLLLPVFLDIYGYLDQKTYVTDIQQNAFYENSTEAVLIYSYYKYLLIAIYVILVTICLSLILSSFMKRVARYRIQCYRLYFPYHCMVCVIPFVLRYANITAITPDDIMAAMDLKRLFLIISSIFRFIFFSVCCTKVQVLEVSVVFFNNSDSFFNYCILFLYY